MESAWREIVGGVMLIVMDGLILGDWLSVPALVGAGGWALSSAMAVHGLHLASQNKRRSLIYIGLCLFVFILTTFLGAQQHRDAREAERATEDIKVSLDGISKTLESSNNLTPDQVLKAASKKIIEQGNQIRELQKGHRENDRLYQDNIEVARISGIVSDDKDRNKIYLNLVTSLRELVFSKQFELQGAIISCDKKDEGGAIIFGAQSFISYSNVVCHINGPREP